MLAEMARVVRPGGLVYCSYTLWLSPWGGHETSPWHFLGGHRAARRYEQRHGHPMGTVRPPLTPVPATFDAAAAAEHAVAAPTA